MAAAAEVLSMSKTKSSIRSKMKKPAVKTYLCNPYNVVWPQVSEDHTSFVLEKLKSTFEALELRKPIDRLKAEKPSEYKAFNRLKSSERKEFIQNLNKDHQEGQNLRSQLVFGFQAVTKHLDKDELQVVLADRDSWDLIKHLTQLVAVRDCPGMALRGLSGVVAPLVGLTTLSALGFKKPRSGDSDKFSTITEEIISKCELISLPWLSLENELQEIKESSRTSEPEHCDGPVSRDSDSRMDEISKCDDSTAMGETNHSPKDMVSSGTPEQVKGPKDFSHLYIYKSQCPPRPYLVFEEEGTERITVKRDGIEKSDFIGFDEDSSVGSMSNTGAKRKKGERSAKSDGPRKRAKNSNWQEMVLGKVQANKDRQKKQSKKQ